ncbi:MAG: hypothetical protein ACXV3A_12445 [Kineosporiaceae bacterium]
MTGATGIVPAVVVTIVVVMLAACTGGTAESTSAHNGSAPTSASEPASPSAGASGSTPPGEAPWTPAPGETRSAAQLLQAARDAFSGASSVHVTGTAVRGSDAYIVDVRMAGATGGTATINTSGQTVDVTRIGDVAYVGGDLAFWRGITGDDNQARQMVGTHVRTGASEGNFASFVQLTQPSTFAAALPDPAKSATVGPMSRIRGTTAVGVRDSSGSTIYLAASGPAYPLRLDGLARGQVVFLDFSDYGARVPLPAPSPGRVVGQGPGS